MLCSVYQWLISAALDGDKPLGRLTTRHVERCRRCGEFWRASAAVDHRLRVEACAAAPVSQRSARSVLPLPHLVGRALLSGFALAAIILLAVALGPPGPKPVRVRGPEPPDPVGVVLAPVDEVQHLAAASAQAEMDHLAQDTRDAARMLLSYLPTSADQITNPR